MASASSHWVAEVGPLYRGGSVVEVQRSYFDELDWAIERAFGARCDRDGREIGADEAAPGNQSPLSFMLG